MNRNTTIGLIAAVVVVILAFILFVLPSLQGGRVNDETNDEEVSETDEQSQEENDDVDSVMSGDWGTYTNDAFNFSIDHRADAEVSVEGETQNVVKFLVMGPSSVEGTELNDAYVLSVATVDMPEGATLESFTEDQFAQSTPPGEAVEGVTAVNFGAVPAYRYRINPIGTLTTVYVLEHPQDGKAYTVSFAIDDSRNRGYADDIKRMLNSFRISSNTASQ